MTMFERFKEVLKPVINAEVTETTTIRSLNLDPMDLFHLITDLEVEFGIEIDDESALKFTTVGEVLKHIDKKVA